jgi:hypothetical protein
VKKRCTFKDFTDAGMIKSKPTKAPKELYLLPERLIPDLAGK